MDVESDPSGEIALFVVLNVIVAPLLGWLWAPLRHLLNGAGAPLWLYSVPAVILGAALLCANAGLTWKAWRKSATGAVAATMLLWTILSVLTLIALGIYSPLRAAYELLTHSIS